jgi:hypothetical protein
MTAQAKSEYEAVFLKTYILAGDFTKVLLPIATDLFTFGWSICTVSQTPHKASTTHMTGVTPCYLNESSSVVFWVTFISSNSMVSNFEQHGHRVCTISFISQAVIAWFTANVSWQRGEIISLVVFDSFSKPATQTCNLNSIWITYFVYWQPYIYARTLFK